MIVENRLRIFNAFLTEFPKDRPVTKYLPEYFKRNKQMGSRDRKNLSKAIYSYFRLGNCLAGLKSDERLFVALFLTANSPDDMLAYFKPDYQERITNSLAEKAAYLTSLFPEFNLNDIFPFTAHLSSSIDQSLFIMFADDDDRYTPDAFKVIKETIKDKNKLYVFKHMWGGTVNWVLKDFTLGNVGKCMGVIPNTHNLPNFNEDVQGDVYFYSDISKMFESEFIDHIIYKVRDTE